MNENSIRLKKQGAFTAKNYNFFVINLKLLC